MKVIRVTKKPSDDEIELALELLKGNISPGQYKHAIGDNKPGSRYVNKFNRAILAAYQNGLLIIK